MTMTGSISSIGPIDYIPYWSLTEHTQFTHTTIDCVFVTMEMNIVWMNEPNGGQISVMESSILFLASRRKTHDKNEKGGVSDIEDDTTRLASHCVHNTFIYLYYLNIFFCKFWVFSWYNRVYAIYTLEHWMAYNEQNITISPAWGNNEIWTCVKNEGMLASMSEEEKNPPKERGISSGRSGTLTNKSKMFKNILQFI